jgi:hypothetical protein
MHFKREFGILVVFQGVISKFLQFPPNPPKTDKRKKNLIAKSKRGVRGHDPLLLPLWISACFVYKTSS